MAVAAIGYKHVAKDQNKKFIALRKKLAESDISLDGETDLADIEKMAEVPYVHLTAIVFRKRYLGYKRWADAIAQILPPKYAKELPFIVPAGKSGEVYVYTNIPLVHDRLYYPEQLKEVSFCVHADLLRPIYDEVMKDLADEKRKVRWSEFSRGKKIITKRERMPVSRVLARFTSMIEDGIKDSSIRDMADKIAMELRPVELIVADTPEKACQMYMSGPHSCMAATSDIGKRWKQLVADRKMPSLFYYYHPNYMGVYYMKNGQVAARTLLIRSNTARKEFLEQTTPLEKKSFNIKDYKYYVRIYSSTTEMANKLQQMLAEHGIVATPSVDIRANFNIPGIWNKELKDYFMPLPYIDYRQGDLHFTFDPKSKEFLLRVNPKDLPTGVERRTMSSSEGFVGAKTVLGAERCHSCGVRMTGVHRITRSQDGHAFCGANCVSAAGYVPAMDSEGVHRIIPRDATLYFDPVGSRVFTNREAAIRRGALPLLTFQHILNSDYKSDDRVTVEGYHVVWNGNRYNCAPATWEQLTATMSNIFRYQCDHNGDYILTIRNQDLFEGLAASKTQIDW